MFFRKLLRCSFCGKNQTEVSKLVAGPRVYICDECESVVSRIIDGPSETPNPPPANTPKLLGILTRVVSFVRRVGSRIKYELSWSNRRAQTLIYAAAFRSNTNLT